MTPAIAGSYGLIGFGIPMFNPPCAYACQRILVQTPLRCSDYYGHADSIRTRSQHVKQHNDHFDFITSAECLAGNEPYLLSLAWCLNQSCVTSNEKQEIRLWQLEKVWSETAAQQGKTIAEPTLSFEKALEGCGSGPRKALNRQAILYEPCSVPQDEYEAWLTYLEDFSRVERQHPKYG